MANENASTEDVTIDLSRIRLRVQGTRITTAEEREQPEEALTADKVVDLMQAAFKRALLAQGAGGTLGQETARHLSLCALRGDIQDIAEPMTLPQNADKVTLSAEKFLIALREVPEAKVIDASPERLSRLLAREHFLAAMLASTEWFPKMVAANRAQVLGEIDQLMRGAISGARSFIDRSTRLQTALQVPLRHISGPGELAAETRKDYARVAAKALSEERAKNPPPPVAGPQSGDPGKDPKR